MLGTWAKDIVSPTNLWGIAQVVFPAGTALVSTWLSYLWKLPPSLNMLLALVSAAAVLVIISELRRNSVRGKMVLQHLGPQRFIWNATDKVGLVQLKAIFKNNDPLHRIFYRLETLNLVLQGYACAEGPPHSDILEISPNGEAGYLFFPIDGIRVAPITGGLRYRVHYGKSEKNLPITFEQKLHFKGQVVIDAKGDPIFDLNWLIEETK